MSYSFHAMMLMKRKRVIENEGEEQAEGEPPLCELCGFSRPPALGAPSLVPRALPSQRAEGASRDSDRWLGGKAGGGCENKAGIRLGGIRRPCRGAQLPEHPMARPLDHPIPPAPVTHFPVSVIGRVRWEGEPDY
jgi:hypothetical protein